MANNRLFLTYRPSGLSVYLGKRLASGYYGVPEDVAEKIQKLFDLSEKSFHSFDDFCLCVEDSDGCPGVIAGF